MLLRWAIIVFIVLLLIDSTTGILAKLPGDLRFPLGRRTLRLPFTSALLLAILLLVGLKSLAWLAQQL